jgi:uncharacterized protein
MTMKVKVRVVPRAKKEKIIEENGVLKVYVNDPALEGKANKRVIEMLAEFYKTKKYNITIVQGQLQRDKIVEIQ